MKEWCYDITKEKALTQRRNAALTKSFPSDVLAVVVNSQKQAAIKMAQV